MLVVFLSAPFISVADKKKRPRSHFRARQGSAQLVDLAHAQSIQIKPIKIELNGYVYPGSDSKSSISAGSRAGPQEGCNVCGRHNDAIRYNPDILEGFFQPIR